MYVTVQPGTRAVSSALALSLAVALAVAVAPAQAGTSDQVGGAQHAAAKKKKKARCAKGRFRLPGRCVRGTAVHAYLLEGSVATLDFGSGVTRQTNLTGKVLANIPSVNIDIRKQVGFGLDALDISPSPVGVLSDPSCGGETVNSSALTKVTLDPAKKSAGVFTIAKFGAVATATAFVRVRTVLDVRATCDQPLVPTGYMDTFTSYTGSGKLGRFGLNALEVIMAPTPTTIKVCMVPGDPGQPCAGMPINVNVTISARLLLKVRVCLAGRCPSDVV